MAREKERLSALAVTRAKVPGMYPDGDGLYLQVSGDGAKSWIYRFMLAGRSREMGLGSLNSISLSEARNKAREARSKKATGVDPIEDQIEKKAAKAAQKAKLVTFKSAAETYIDSHKAGWKNAKHVQQWENTLATYAYPIIGHLSVADIDLNLILKVLNPIWNTKTETASRLRGRLEKILDAAKAREQRTGENPARWNGSLKTQLPEATKIRKVRHHAALPYDEMGAFMRDLRQQEGFGARGLELAILTVARTNEVIAAKWSEIDLTKKTWTIPEDRMKAKKEHRVPLSDAAVAILNGQKQFRRVDDFVFPSHKIGKHISNMAFLALLKRMERSEITPHGFRSTFRDWCAEQTAYPREVAEMSLAHAIEDKVEAAYRRGDLFEKRRRLMADWARFCGKVIEKRDSKVVTLRN